MNEQMTYRSFIVLMIFLIGAACMTGCSEKQHPPPDVYVIKEKFHAIAPCGYAASTDYDILTELGKVIHIADTCPITRDGMDGMEYYSVWNDAEPGDTLVVDMYNDPRFVLKKK